jgi:hypothetical protein
MGAYIFVLLTACYIVGMAFILLNAFRAQAIKEKSWREDSG